MRILVVGSCSKKKLNQSVTSPTCKDLASIEDIKTWREKSCYPSTRVRDLYTGNQNRELVNGVDLLRQIEKTEVKLFVISAGFGLVEEKDTLPPYDCSFSGMKKFQIQERAEWMKIPLDFEELLESEFDLVYLAVGKKYFLTLGEEWKSKSKSTIIGFNQDLPDATGLSVPSAHKIVSAFSRNGHKIHGVTGFKGDLLRILADYALKQKNPYREIISWTHPVYLRDLVMKLGNLEFWY